MCHCCRHTHTRTHTHTHTLHGQPKADRCNLHMPCLSLPHTVCVCVCVHMCVCDIPTPYLHFQVYHRGSWDVIGHSTLQARQTKASQTVSLSFHVMLFILRQRRRHCSFIPPTQTSHREQSPGNNEQTTAQSPCPQLSLTQSVRRHHTQSLACGRPFFWG